MLSEFVPIVISFPFSVPVALAPCWSSSFWAYSPSSRHSPACSSQPEPPGGSIILHYILASLSHALSQWNNSPFLPENFNSLEPISMLPLLWRSHCSVKQTQVSPCWELQEYLLSNQSFLGMQLRPFIYLLYKNRVRWLQHRPYRPQGQTFYSLDLYRKNPFLYHLLISQFCTVCD